MTFIDALKTGRPMRRKSTVYTPPWINLGDVGVASSQRYPWIRIDTGAEVYLARWDFLAEDWEVQP